MAFDPQLQARIEDVNRRLRRFSSRLGYVENRQGGRVASYTVHTDVLGDKRIVIAPGQERAAQEALLRELTNLAIYYKLGSATPAPTPPQLPGWLTAPARALCERALRGDPVAPGLYRFGNRITVRGAVADRPVENHDTNEQVIHISPTSLDMFRYFPCDQTRYRDAAQFEVAMEWNFSLWHYVERQHFPPSVARERLIAVNREMYKALIFAFSAIGVSGASNAPTLPDGGIGSEVGGLLSGLLLRR
jgi:hypothetical protein